MHVAGIREIYNRFSDKRKRKSMYTRTTLTSVGVGSLHSTIGSANNTINQMTLWEREQRHLCGFGYGAVRKEKISDEVRDSILKRS